MRLGNLRTAGHPRRPGAGRSGWTDAAARVDRAVRVHRRGRGVSHRRRSVSRRAADHRPRASDRRTYRRRRPHRSPRARLRAAMTAPLVLDADAVRAACSPAAAVEAITAALRAGMDPASDLPRQAVPLRSGQFLLMPSDAQGGAHAGIKVATVAPDNPARGLPRIQASYLLFDAESLSLVATLDGTALTTLRTPAVSVAAVAPRLRAGSGSVALAVFGAGPQAHGHVATLAAVLS